MTSIGLGVTDVEKKGIMLPVILSHCEYSIGAKFEQEITVRAKISSIPRSRLHIDYYVFINNEREILVSGYTEHTFINDKGVAVRAPKMILDCFHQQGLVAVGK